MDFSATWDWPQWFVVIALFARWSLQTGKHGEEMLVESGERKGLPMRWNGFQTASTTAMYLLVLIAGGFFS